MVGLVGCCAELHGCCYTGTDYYRRNNSVVLPHGVGASHSSCGGAGLHGGGDYQEISGNSFPLSLVSGRNSYGCGVQY